MLWAWSGPTHHPLPITHHPSLRLGSIPFHHRIICNQWKEPADGLGAFSLSVSEEGMSEAHSLAIPGPLTLRNHQLINSHYFISSVWG